MARAPRLLDLFCGGGGAAMGYHRAGFDVVGVDIVPQPRYPFDFVLADAMTFPLDGFDAIHASPPCQAFSTLRSRHKEQGYPELVLPTLARLEASGVPWVVENVKRAPLGAQIMLCGSAFGLGANGHYLRRHRYFALSFPLPALVPPCQHIGWAIGVHGGGESHDRRAGTRPRGYQAGAAESAEALGIDWLPKTSLAQAIPPAFTEWIGQHLLAEVVARA